MDVLEPEGVVREGFLEKQSPNKALGKRWQTRYFTLTHAALHYRKTQQGETFSLSQHHIPLSHCF
jgi:hypothetical protein